MSGREFKPGVVVRLCTDDRRTDGTLRTAIGVVTDKPIGERGWLHWYYADGADAGDHGCHLEMECVRPLVVIDPEDREQVDRLTKVLVEAAHAHGNHIVSDNGIHPDTTQAALRSLITPPKPEEPTGLGAVVEDHEGVRWVRTHTNSHPWRTNLVADDRNCVTVRKYANVHAVRVLSEGVTA